MKSLAVIMAHAEAQYIFDRHLSFWQKYEDTDLLVFCPQDSVVKTYLPVLAIGGKCHHGPPSIRRFRNLLRYLETTRYLDFIIFEYDALYLGDDEPASLGIYGQITANLWDNTEPHRFKGSHYLHPPIAFSNTVLEQINRAAMSVPDDAEESFWDRWLGLVCDKASIVPIPWGERGFSRNTIEPQDIPAAVAAYKAGATMFHGIKSEAVLKAFGL